MNYKGLVEKKNDLITRRDQQEGTHRRRGAGTGGNP